MPSPQWIENNKYKNLSTGDMKKIQDALSEVMGKYPEYYKNISSQEDKDKK